MRPEPARKAFTRGRRLAKRPPDVQQAGRVFPAVAETKKPPESSGFSRFRRIAAGPRSEPLGAALPAAITVAVAVHAAHGAVMLPAFAAAEPAHMGQDREAALLAVIQR